MDRVRYTDKKAKMRSEENFARSHGARPLSKLQEDQQVKIRLPKDKNWSSPTEILKARGDNSYLVRNRRFLMPIPDLVPSKKTGQDARQPVASAECSESQTEVMPTTEPPGLAYPELAEVPELTDNDSCSGSQNDVPRSRYGRIINPNPKYR